MRYKKIAKLARLSSTYIQEFGVRNFCNIAWYELKKNRISIFTPESSELISHVTSENNSYKQWLLNHSTNGEFELRIRTELQSFVKKPQITLAITINQNNKSHLKRTLISIVNQIYDDWSIVLVFPDTLSREINEIIASVSYFNGITNSKMSQTNSLNNILNELNDFIAFFNCGQIISRDALFRVVKSLNENSNHDIIYSDEDEIDENEERINPFFKPDWSPDLFLGFDYISNFYIIRTQLLRKSSGFNEQFGDAIHYELLLRLTEITEKICHIPSVLISIDKYHKSKAHVEKNNKDALVTTLTRRGLKANIVTGLIHNTFRIKYSLDKEPKVSIIIPTKDQKNILKRCITSIERKTSYKNYEIIIMDNNSAKEETISYLKSLPYTIIKYNSPFNFSKINNLAASHASGDYILFLNDDTAALQDDWLTEMVSICQQEKIGIVGAKLVLHNNSIQHAGLTFLKTGAGFHPLQGVNADSPGYFGFLNVIRNYSAVTGACLLISKKIFNEINGYDEKFDLYYGDADLCIKTLKKGYRVVYTPHAKLIHQGSSSIKEHARSFFAVENHYDFIKKWPYLKNGDPFYNPNLTWDFKIEVI